MRMNSLRPRHRPALRLAMVIGLVAGALHTAPAEAQNRDSACIAQYNTATEGNSRFRPINIASPGNGCRRVATALSSDWPQAALFGTSPDARDMSATRGQTTAAPGEVTAPIEPVEAAGGSVAAVGTRKGAGAVAAVAINPSIFFVSPTDTLQVARWSRFTDVTLLVPASDLSESQGDDESADDAEYVGLRWGLNLTGFSQGSAFHRTAVAAFDKFLEDQRVQTDHIKNILANVPAETLDACVGALAAVQTLDSAANAGITAACGAPAAAMDTAAIRAYRDAIEAARIAADSRYLGLDLRADFGDLTFAGVDTLPGTSLFAGLGWGRRSVSRTDASTGIRAHVGVRYWDLEGAESENTAVEGGVAFEAIRFYDYQRLTLVGGLDLQHRTTGNTPDDDDDDGDDTSINLRGSLNVPFGATSSVSVHLAAPVVGERRGPVLSIKANWRILRSPSF